MASDAREPRDDERDELLSEIHDLRSRNQNLRVELARFDRPRNALRQLVLSIVGPARRKARHTAGRMLRATLRRGRGAYHDDFRPYAARLPEAAQAGRPRVLHAIANFRTGGSARLVVDLIEGLGAEYVHGVVVREDPPIKGYEGIALDAYPELTSSRPLERLFSKLKPDIVHVHYVADAARPESDIDYRWYIHVFEAAERAGVKVVENVNIPTMPYRSAAVARYVYVSDFVRRRYARTGDPTAVIHPGSDLDHFRRPADVNGPANTVGMVYRLEPDKLDEASFDPLAEVLRRREDARALVVGGGQLLPVYQRSADEAGVADRVTFTGYVAYDDLPGWYARMNAFAAPVHSESFGHVSVLAMGMELPVAGYDVGALGEIVGDPDLLAPPGDAAALADILVKLLDEPDRSREIGARNRDRAERCFSVEQMVEAYRSFYAECVSAR